MGSEPFACLAFLTVHYNTHHRMIRTTIFRLNVYSFRQFCVYLVLPFWCVFPKVVIVFIFFLYQLIVHYNTHHRLALLITLFFLMCILYASFAGSCTSVLYVHGSQMQSLFSYFFVLIRRTCRLYIHCRSPNSFRWLCMFTVIFCFRLH